MKNKEFRSFGMIASTDDEMVLKGTIPYESKSEYMGFYEILKRGCFKKTVNESRDIQFLEEHDPSKLRARGKNGSFIVNEDDEGVHFEAHLVDTSENRDLYTKVKSGLLSNVSFGFSVVKERIVDGIRNILEARLYEISAVGSPAYAETTLNTRSLSEVMKEKETLDDADKTSIEEEIATLTAMLGKKDEPEAPNEEPQEPPKEEPSVVGSEPQSETDTPPQEEPKEPSEEEVFYSKLLERLEAVESLLTKAEEQFA